MSDLQRAYDGVARIAAERRRQITSEGWTTKDDDEHDRGQLAAAAAWYVLPVGSARERYAEWPWYYDDPKPGPTRIRELEKAGALIAAEIDRLLRAKKVEEG